MESALSMLTSAKNLSCWLNGRAILETKDPNLYLDGFSFILEKEVSFFGFIEAL